MDAELLAQIAKMVGELTIALAEWPALVRVEMTAEQIARWRQSPIHIEITREQAARWRQTVKDAARQLSQSTVAIEPDSE